MHSSTENGDGSTQLIRGVGLGSATTLNMIDMIGVGPFITLPLIVGGDGWTAGDAWLGTGGPTGSLRWAGLG